MQIDENIVPSRLLKLYESMAEFIEEHDMISFVPLAVEDKECMVYLLQEVDRANGYVFGTLAEGNEGIFDVSVVDSRKEAFLDYVSSKYLSTLPTAMEQDE